MTTTFFHGSQQTCYGEDVRFKKNYFVSVLKSVRHSTQAHIMWKINRLQ